MQGNSVPFTDSQLLNLEVLEGIKEALLKKNPSSSETFHSPPRELIEAIEEVEASISGKEEMVNNPFPLAKTVGAFRKKNLLTAVAVQKGFG